MTLTESIQIYYAAKKEAERHFSAKVAYWQGRVRAGAAKQEAVNFINRDIEIINAVTAASDNILRLSSSADGAGSLSNSDWQLIATVQAKFRAMELDIETAYFRGYQDAINPNRQTESKPVFSSKEDRRSWTIANARNRDNF